MPRLVLTAVLSALLVLALAAVGVLAWTSISLSNRVNELSLELTSMTTTTALPSTTTTALPSTTTTALPSTTTTTLLPSTTTLLPSTTTTQPDPWRGYSADAYLVAYRDFNTVRQGVIETAKKVIGSGKSGDLSNFLADLKNLAQVVEAFPEAPVEMRKLQDEYYIALLDEYRAVVDLQASYTKSNVELVNAAADGEWKALMKWRLEVERLGVVP